MNSSGCTWEMARKTVRLSGVESAPPIALAAFKGDRQLVRETLFKARKIIYCQLFVESILSITGTGGSRPIAHIITLRVFPPNHLNTNE
jgi:hypothetical protein